MFKKECIKFLFVSAFNVIRQLRASWFIALEHLMN